MNSSGTGALIVSIVVFLFCQPLGIVGIVFAALSMSAENTGDMVTAGRHLKTANTINMIALVVLLLSVLAAGLFCLVSAVGSIAFA